MLGGTFILNMVFGLKNMEIATKCLKIGQFGPIFATLFKTLGFSPTHSEKQKITVI
jgi:hypothetical protein